MYDSDKVFKGAAALAAKGLKVVKIYGLRDDLTCTCQAGGDCKTPGKHPVGKDWGHAATDDEGTIAEWFEAVNDNVRWNIGVRLGAASGVIDVEADDDRAMEVLQRFELDQIHTVAYRGSRGPHYLFRYEDDLPDAGVVKVDGLEVRIGGGLQSTQSVFPPSQHKSGAEYAWLPGRSPDEAEIAILPAEFKACVLQASRGGGSGVIRQAREAMIAGEQIGEGNRHSFLLGWASRLNRRNAQFTEAEKLENFELLCCINAARCEPPKGLDEVLKLNNDQFDYYRQQRAERRAVRPLEKHGLLYHEGEYWPGEWRMSIVHSDPKEILVFVPSGREKPWRIPLTVEEAVDPKAVALAVLSVADIDLRTPTAKRWNAVWSGYTVEDDEGHEREVQGLFSKLHEAATHEYPGGDDKRYVQFARIVIEFLDSYPEVFDAGGEDGRPNVSGFPKLIRGRDGTVLLWFKWRESLKAAFRQAGDANYCEKRAADFKARVLEAVNQKHFTTRAVTGKSGRWTIWDEKYLAAVRELADGG